MNKDTILVSLSDMHSGSDRALFPNWDVSPMPRVGDESPSPMRGSEKQKKIFAHFTSCASEIKKRATKDKRLVIVNDGDAIEGIHHGTIQIMSPQIDDHVVIHTELMEYFLKQVGFSRKRGDELHYVTGTESHTAWKEGAIIKRFDHLDAGYHDELKLNINGRQVWYTHHGGTAGDGHSEGDGYRNWLKRIYFNNLKLGNKQPDVIFSAHVHKPIYSSYVQDYHTIHGMILPSWQMKTRFAYRAAPFQRNDIGLNITEITKEGDIRINKPLIMDM